MKLFSKSKSEDSVVEEISQTVQAVQEDGARPGRSVIIGSDVTQ